MIYDKKYRKENPLWTDDLIIDLTGSAWVLGMITLAVVLVLDGYYLFLDGYYLFLT